MAKKVENIVKLQIPAGKATPAPPVGPALGQAGINIMGFTKEFNARTADQAGMIIPVVISVYEDKSFGHQHLFYNYYIAGSNRSVLHWEDVLFWGNNKNLTYFNLIVGRLEKGKGRKD